jgi:hypothetical protein
MGHYGQVVQYNVIQSPFTESDVERQESEVKSQVTDGTIYTIGLAPTLILPVNLAENQIKFKAGADGWTQFFSRPQYRNDTTSPDEHDKFGLAEEANENSVPEEDVAQRYYTQYMIGASVKPRFAPQVEVAMGMYYDVRFLPEYEAAAGSTDYSYIKQETSHYRARFEYELTERTSFINDFYHFHGGLFEAKRIGDDRRFRNIARLSYKL